MDADTIFTNIAQTASPRGTGAVRGGAMADLEIIEDAAIAVTDGLISWIGPRHALPMDGLQEQDCGGQAIVPALIDPHTHAIWAGHRLDDFESRVAGMPYEAILARGGGIHATIAHTAAASPEQLATLAADRVANFVAGGAAVVEMKSGYGFTREAELASLEAIALVATMTEIQILPTLLIHVPPRDPAEREAHIGMVCRELIPEVAERGLATAVDVFIEREAFTVGEAERIFAAAHGHGLGVKAHADQFTAIGGVEAAIAHGALSVDHLEASGPAQVAALAASGTVATILPGVTLHLGLPAAPGRALIDAGAIVAIGTDCNPGSSPLYSQQLALAFAVRLCGLTPAEALTACTANAAAALGLTTTGRLAVGMRADFLRLGSSDWREVACAMGSANIGIVHLGGDEIFG